MRFRAHWLLPIILAWTELIVATGAPRLRFYTSQDRLCYNKKKKFSDSKSITYGIGERGCYRHQQHRWNVWFMTGDTYTDYCFLTFKQYDCADTNKNCPIKGTDVKTYLAQRPKGKEGRCMSIKSKKEQMFSYEVVPMLCRDYFKKNNCPGDDSDCGEASICAPRADRI